MKKTSRRKKKATIRKKPKKILSKKRGFLRTGTYVRFIGTSERTDMDKLREQAYREGVKPLRISGALKVAAGITTVDEVMKVAPPMQDRRNAPR